MKILLFVPKGFEIYEFSALFDILSWADKEFGYNTKVVTCGFNKQVISAFGVKITVDSILDEINSLDYDALAIPGGFEEYGFYDDVYNKTFLDIICEFHNKNKIIASVCVGSLALGKSGVLMGNKATTYFSNDGYRQKELSDFDVNVVNESMVVDKNIITSNSPGTAINVAFKLLEMLTSTEKMLNVKNAMGFKILN
jgi:4-methyl-5(b-hydroxyethyl)-thiazole monophosphate biosynthesis